MPGSALALPFLPKSRRGLILLGLLTLASAVWLLGEQGAKIGGFSPPVFGLGGLLGLAALGFFLTPRSFQRPSVFRLAGAVIALALGAAPVFLWRHGLIEPGSTLVARVTRASDPTERLEKEVLVRSLEMEDRRVLHRVAGRRRDISLEIDARIWIPETGDYNLAISCDDGCRLQLGEAAPVDVAGAKGVIYHLEAGLNPIAVRYRQAGGPAFLHIDWNRPALVELLPMSHYISGLDEVLDGRRLKRKEAQAGLSLLFGLLWWGLALGLVLRIGESRTFWKELLSSGRAARWVPLTSAAALIAYGALLRFDALLVHSGLAAREPLAGAIHARLGPALPGYGSFNLENMPLDPYRADVRSYLDRAASMRSFYEASFREPFYVVLVRVFLAIFGGREIGILVESFFFSVVALPLFFSLAAHVVGRWWALATLLPVVLHEWLVLEAPTGYRMSAYSLFLLAFTGCVFVWRSRRWWADALLAGVLGAMVGLIRLSGLSFILPLLALAMWTRRGQRPWRYGLACLLTLAALVGPFMWSCYRERGDPFYSVSFHTRFWIEAEKEARGGGEGPGPAAPVGLVRYFVDYRSTGELLRGILRGLTILPLRTFATGLGQFPLLKAAVLAAGVAGLLLGLRRESYILVAYLGHLVPFAYIQNFPSGQMPRFVMPAYFFFVLAAGLAFRWLCSFRPEWALSGSNPRPTTRS